MRLIQRYLFRQLLGPTLLATAALTGVAVLSQSLSALDILVDQRQSPLVYAEITLLAMPLAIAMILPVAVLIAALMSLNRLHTEQEIVICFAGGMSRWRVVAPAFQLAAAMTLVTLAITLWVQPVSYRAMRQLVEDAKSDLAATMVKPGQFTHPAPGLTIYAQAMDDDGTIHNLFVNQRRLDGRDVTVTAREGRLLKRGGAPVLIMKNGANQDLSKTGVLNFLSFDEYDFDLRPLMSADPTIHYKTSDRFLHELFFPDLRQEWEQRNRKKLWAEGHSRLASPLYNLGFMSLALAAVIGGSFSRLGYGTRIAGAAVTALVVRTLGFAAQAAAGGTPAFNALQYLLPLALVLAGAMVIFGRGGRRRAAAHPGAALAGQPA